AVIADTDQSLLNTSASPVFILGAAPFRFTGHGPVHCNHAKVARRNRNIVSKANTSNTGWSHDKPHTLTRRPLAGAPHCGLPLPCLFRCVHGRAGPDALPRGGAPLWRQDGPRARKAGGASPRLELPAFLSATDTGRP